MESISIIKGATSVKKEAAKVQRQKSFFLLKYHMLLFSALIRVKPETLLSKEVFVVKLHTVYPSPMHVGLFLGFVLFEGT